jgi:hypothetical protein
MLYVFSGPYAIPGGEGHKAEGPGYLGRHQVQGGLGSRLGMVRAVESMPGVGAVNSKRGIRSRIGGASLRGWAADLAAGPCATTVAPSPGGDGRLQTAAAEASPVVAPALFRVVRLNAFWACGQGIGLVRASASFTHFLSFFIFQST